MKPLTSLSGRLILRALNLADAEFIRVLVNEPDWLTYIGDKGVATLADAENYLLTGPLKSYHESGFGLLAIEQKQSGQTVGVCGWLKRSYLPYPDLGFAVLDEFKRQGIAYDAAHSLMTHAHSQHGFTQVMAITSPHNQASIDLLKKLGFQWQQQKVVALNEEPVNLFHKTLLPPRLAD